MIIIKGIIGDEVTLLDIVAQAANQPEQGELRVEIDSPGGDAEEGLRIYGYLSDLGRPVVTAAHGRCGSIASVIFMAGTRRIAGCEIFIHNPFFGDVVASTLTQEALKDGYDYLERIKKEIAGIYASRANIDRKVLQSLMDAETAISPEQAVQIGLATEVATATGESMDRYTPVATTSNTALRNAINQINKLKTEIDMKKKGIAARLKNILTGKIKNLDYTDKDGNVFSVDVPSDRDSQLPEVGDAGTPDGTYTMEDGTTIVIADGVVTEVKAAGSGEEGAENRQEVDVEELQAENSKLRNLLEEAQAALEEYERMENTASKSMNMRRDFTGKKASEEKDPMQKAIDERKAALKPRGWNAKQINKQ